MAVTTNSTIFWDVIPLVRYKFIDNSEEHPASIFRVEMWALKGKAKAASGVTWFSVSYFPFLAYILTLEVNAVLFILVECILLCYYNHEL
jgi:hypothetical protein